VKYDGPTPRSYSQVLGVSPAADVPPHLARGAQRCLRNIVDAVASLNEDAGVIRRHLLSFAEEHDLDTQDIATLFRLLAGEG